MFKVMQWTSNSNWFIHNGEGQYLHSDGKILDGAPEYWPTRELAQAVLDKWQPPKPEHVWVHGDVFENCIGTWIYLRPGGSTKVIHLTKPENDGEGGSTPDIQLKDATFLFNIREKL